MTLPTRPLGRTGIPVSVVGLGAAPLGDLYARLDEETAISTVAAAHRGGITLFDASPHYGNGLAELRCGAALRGVPRDSFVMSTKVGRWMDPRVPGGTPVRLPDVAAPGFVGGVPHRSVIDYSYDGALRSFEQSLLRLGFDRIDIVLIHDVDVWTHGEAADLHFGEAIEGAYRALHRLREEGVVRAIGVGINEVEMCVRFAEAGDFDCMLLAGRYSLLEQPALERFLPLALKKGIGVMLGGVFNSGILATGAVPGARFDYKPAPPEIMARVERIEAVAQAHGVALAQAAVRFPLGHPAIASVVLGAVAPTEVERNLTALAAPVPAGLWSDLKAEGLLDRDAPTPS